MGQSPPRRVVSGNTLTSSNSEVDRFRTTSTVSSNTANGGTVSAVAAPKTIKLLLYGPGESGKTTILRQMMLLSGDSLLDERKRSKALICSNVIEGAFFTIDYASRFNIAIDDPKSVEAASLVKDAYDECSISPSQSTLNNQVLVDAILYLYQDPNFQQVLDRKAEYPLYENWIYFAEKLKEYPKWGGPDWIPSAEDLLHSRITTTGKNDFKFESNGIQYQLIDIGGQRAERQKFFQLFNTIHCIVFLASISDYDRCCFEDDTENRLAETVKIWGQTVRHKDFVNTWFLLFLNKFDKFQEKYYRKQIPIRLTFEYKNPPPTYDQEVDDKCDLAVNWYRKLFTDCIPPTKKDKVRIYVTSSLDPKNNNIDRVMAYCTDFLIHNALGNNVL